MVADSTLRVKQISRAFFVSRLTIHEGYLNTTAGCIANTGSGRRMLEIVQYVYTGSLLCESYAVFRSLQQYNYIS